MDKYYRSTPLHESAISGKISLFKAIYNRCENKNLRDSEGKTPLHLAVGAARKGFSKVVEFLLAQDEVDKNAPSDFPTESGRTPLHEGAQEGLKEVFKQLLACEEIDVNRKCSLGRTALHYAAQNGHFDIITLLLNDERVEKNPIDENGKTPADLAWDPDLKAFLRSKIRKTE